MTEWKGEKITPENMDRISKEMDAEWQEYLKHKDEKPSWMIDENSTLGEKLQFHAVTVPFKWQQIIEIEEQAALRYEELAKIFKKPEDKERWLKSADRARQHAQEMRLKWGIIRAGAEEAMKEIDELA